MANLLTRLWRREPEISRLSFNDVIQLIAQKTSPFGVMNGPVTYTGRRPSERVENSFRGYINGAYKVNPIVFGIMTKRASVLSEARFAWREKVAGKPGDIYYDDALSVLENPWPNGTTGELIARMIQDVDLAGNCYIVNEGDRLRRLRPDWVQIVLTGDPLRDLDVDVYGYLYTAGGLDSGGESKAYLPSDMCHWSPSPDPDALYRGMSWITPVIREIMADQVAVTHKLKFFENGAVLGPIITAPPGLTISQFQEFVDAAESAHRGAENAYKTLYLAGGTDVTLASANMQQMDFSGLQGKTETRLCVAANMPASIAGVSEGLQGSSLNAGNYGAAKREWADTWLRPEWRSLCAALSTIVTAPDDADLWYDECDVTFLHEDQQDAATIAQLQMATIVSGITGGFEPDSTVITVNPAWKDTLKHSGLMSVQLTPPGQGELPPDGGAPAGPTGSPTDLPPIPPGFEPDATVRALLAAADMLRATQSQNTGNTGGGGGTLHEPKGSPKGGQFTANPGGGGYKSILPPDSGYKSGGGGSRKSAGSSAPSGTPQPPAEPRTMKVGDSGEDVRYAQYGLSLLGFNVKQDGVYGPETEAAVKEMQARLGVKKPNGHLSASQLRQIQTAVRLSPCIGRSEADVAQDMFDEIMRAFEEDLEAEESGDDDLEEDLDGDDEGEELTEEQEEATAALVEAVEELREGVARSFNEALHPRNPVGSVGGGRFRSLGARIVEALKGAKSDEDRAAVLNGFSQPQLRKAAVDLGLNPPKGMRAAPLKGLILGHATGDHHDAPSAPSPRADAKGVDLDQIKAKLEAATSNEEAAQYIDGLNLKVAELKQLAADLNVPLVGTTKSGIRDDIVKVHVSGRLFTNMFKAAPFGGHPGARADAKAKYAKVAQSRPYASAAAAIAELTGKKQSNAVIAEHVRAIAHPDSPDMAELKPAAKAGPVDAEHLGGVLDALESDLRGIPAGRRKDALGGMSSADVVKVYRDRLASGELKPEQVGGLLQRLLFQNSDAGGPVDPHTANLLKGVGEKPRLKDPRLAQAIHKAIDETKGTPKSSTGGTAAHDLGQVASAFEAGNPTLGKRRMTAALRKQGITQGPGGTVPFDPAAHEHLGDVPEAGTPVSVVRPGMSLHRGEGDHVQLSKAVVMSAPAKKAAVDAQARSGWKPGDKLTHKNRGEVTYLGPDTMDTTGTAGSGSAQWVEFDDGNSGMVSADQLSGYVPPGKAPAKVAKATSEAPKSPAEILSSLPADLTPAQQRARLRSRGVSKEEIDALVPLKSAKAPRTPLGPGGADDLAEEFYRHPKYTEQQIHDRLAGLNLAELKKVATATNVGLPRDLIKTEAGPVLQPLRKISADDLRKWIAAKIAGDRKLLANENKFDAGRSRDLDDEDLIRSDLDEDDDEDYDDEPSPMELAAMAAEEVDEDVERAVGADVIPGHDELHHYWTRDPEGLAKWAESPKPWTTLVAHLTKYVGPEKAKIYASRWFIEVFHYAAGSDANRVAHGKPPRGHRVGPG